MNPDFCPLEDVPSKELVESFGGVPRAADRAWKFLGYYQISGYTGYLKMPHAHHIFAKKWNDDGDYVSPSLHQCEIIMRHVGNLVFMGYCPETDKAVWLKGARL